MTEYVSNFEQPSEAPRQNVEVADYWLRGLFFNFNGPSINSTHKQWAQELAEKRFEISNDLRKGIYGDAVSHNIGQSNHSSLNALNHVQIELHVLCKFDSPVLV